MKVLVVTKELQSDYDMFVKNHPRGSFRQGYAWGEVMNYDQAVIRLAVEQFGKIVGVISLQKKSIPRTGYSFFYAPRGPIVNIGDVRALKVLLEKTRELANVQRAIFLRVDPDALDDDVVMRQWLSDSGFLYLQGKDWSYFNYPRVLMRLDITPDEDMLLGNFRKKHRQHINGALVKGVVLTEVISEEGLQDFYNLMTALSLKKGFPLRRFEYYKKLVSVFGKDIRILLAKHDGELLAGVMALVYGQRAWYMHGASLEEKRLYPSEALHWDMIRWAKSNGCVFYDFGGTGTEFPPREDNPNYSLYHFKKGFGAEINYLTGYYDLVFRKPSYVAFRALEENVLPHVMKGSAFLKQRLSAHE
jgi:lipid II:glycine glycyltransferase (peptidoglycan interpeptide bridge formation enzyme)